MLLHLSSEDKEYLQDACKRAAPREACGIVTGSRVFELPNRSPNLGSFRITAVDLESLSRKVASLRDRGIEGIWHTHPSNNPYPSDLDVADHPWPAALVIATREVVTVYGSPAECPRYAERVS